MPSCDMCGTEGQLFITEIEGTRLQVCKNCSSYGTVKGPARKAAPRKANVQRRARPSPPPEPEWVVVKDYAKRIRDKRESLGLKQEELAKKLAEKESLLHKIETGSFTPGLDLARKIEKILKITLLEKEQPIETKSPSGKKSGGALTLGDIIKVRD